jgi:hypothetical protein
MVGLRSEESLLDFLAGDAGTRWVPQPSILRLRVLTFSSFAPLFYFDEPYRCGRIFLFSTAPRQNRGVSVL